MRCYPDEDEHDDAASSYPGARGDRRDECASLHPPGPTLRHCPRLLSPRHPRAGLGRTRPRSGTLPSPKGCRGHSPLHPWVVDYLDPRGALPVPPRRTRRTDQFREVGSYLLLALCAWTRPLHLRSGLALPAGDAGWGIPLRYRAPGLRPQPWGHPGPRPRSWSDLVGTRWCDTRSLRDDRDGDHPSGQPRLGFPRIGPLPRRRDTSSPRPCWLGLPRRDRGRAPATTDVPPQPWGAGVARTGRSSLHGGRVPRARLPLPWDPDELGLDTRPPDRGGRGSLHLPGLSLLQISGEEGSRSGADSRRASGRLSRLGHRTRPDSTRARTDCAEDRGRISDDPAHRWVFSLRSRALLQGRALPRLVPPLRSPRGEAACPDGG